MTEQFNTTEDKLTFLKNSRIDFNPKSIVDANLTLASIEVKRAKALATLASYDYNASVVDVNKTKHFLSLLARAESAIRGNIVAIVQSQLPYHDEMVLLEELIKVNSTSLKQYFCDNANLIKVLEIKDVCRWENGIPLEVKIYKLIGDDLYFVLDGSPNDRYAFTNPPFHFESYEDFISLSDSIDLTKTKIFFANPII